MNQIRAIQALNKREIENGVPPEASWHTDYRDTAFVNFGGLPYELSEGDIITIFSQYGEPVFLKLARDKESGKSKGFGWLKYEDQRSTDLAVDNLGGAEIGGRLIRVDHARYKPRDDEDPDEFRVGWEDIVRKEKAARGEDVEMEDESAEEEEEVRRPMLKEEKELAKLIAEHDDDDPMKGFLIEEKKQEVERALRKEEERRERKGRKHKHKHRDHHRHHHRSHRSRRDESDEEDRDRSKRSRRDVTPVAGDPSGRDREETPERRRGDSREGERRRGDEDRDRHRDRDRRSRRDDRDDYDQRRSSRRDGEERDRDRDRRRRHQSRSRSPRSYRD
ncbi:hypothetical protein DL770_005138 [Monosporascus sp. CRB-9-2]|nr:hypothetical protein DL770_005138 [Monosporascus sp. CRB-9-2]